MGKREAAYVCLKKGHKKIIRRPLDALGFQPRRGVTLLLSPSPNLFFSFGNLLIRRCLDDCPKGNRGMTVEFDAPHSARDDRKKGSFVVTPTIPLLES
ncbi:MAG: hypothetical protein IJ870_04470 [Alphaproteobacteria bacterium]|nr:hypothetical protein [Alphaproteobacteria bacterium]